MTGKAPSLYDVFPRFVSAKIAEGVSEKTAKTYQQHFHCISKHMDVSAPLDVLTQDDINNLVVSMRLSGLAHNSISSYTRVLRTMLKWCRGQGYTNVYVPPIKDRETVKETYSDDELSALLRKPDKNCDFSEYRNWVIINFLLNCGCRASTVRNIQNRDVDFILVRFVFRRRIPRPGERPIRGPAAPAAGFSPAPAEAAVMSLGTNCLRKPCGKGYTDTTIDGASRKQVSTPFGTLSPVNTW